MLANALGDIPRIEASSDALPAMPTHTIATGDESAILSLCDGFPLTLLHYGFLHDDFVHMSTCGNEMYIHK